MLCFCFFELFIRGKHLSLGPGFITLHHSQVLHGLLNFAGGFYSGRGVRHLGFELLDLRRLSAAHDFVKLRDLAEKAREVLHGTPPRELRCDFVREPICVWD